MVAPAIVGVSPTPNSTGNPLNVEVSVLFDREIDISRVYDGSLFVEGPDFVLTSGPDQALKVDRDPVSLDELINESNYKGILKGTFSFSRVSNTSTASGAYFDYAGSVTAFRHKVTFTFEKPLAPSTTYTVYVVGDDNTTDDFQGGITTRTVFDVVKGTNIGEGTLEATGGYTGVVQDTVRVTITANGAPGTATYEWYMDSTPGIVYQATSSTGPRLLQEGIYIKFTPNTTYVTGDQYSFVVRPPEYIASTYIFSFTTGATTFTSVPETSTLVTTITGDTETSTTTTTESTFEVLSTVPVNRGTNLTQTKMTNIVIEFSEDIEDDSALINQIEVIREAVDGDLSRAEPAYMTYTYVVDGATLTLTLTGDFYHTDRVYTVIVPDFIGDVDGNELGEDYEFYFTSTYSDMYTTLRRLRLEYGRLLVNVPDDAINLAIFIASRVVDGFIPTTYVIPDGTFWALAKQEFTTCYAARILLLGLISDGTGIGSSSLGSKRLDDLAIDKGTAAASGFDTDSLLERLDDCIAVWLLSIQSGGELGPNNALKARYTIPGANNPDRPVFGRMPHPWDRDRIPALNTQTRPRGFRRAKAEYRRRGI